jgi:predicted kinase
VWANRPVVVICGTSATGKSYLARELASISGLTHLSTHSVSAELYGLVALPERGRRAARLERLLHTYAELGRRAAAAGGAIVEGTFRRRTVRRAFAEGYGSGPAPFFVECRAPADVLHARAVARMYEPDGTSSAPPYTVERQRQNFDALDEVSARRHLIVRTDRPLDEIVTQVEAGLRLCARSEASASS